MLIRNRHLPEPALPENRDESSKLVLRSVEETEGVFANTEAASVSRQSLVLCAKASAPQRLRSTTSGNIPSYGVSLQSAP